MLLNNYVLYIHLHVATHNIYIYTKNKIILNYLNKVHYIVYTLLYLFYISKVHLKYIYIMCFLCNINNTLNVNVI